MKKIRIKNFHIGKKEPLAIISGPCVIENEDHTLKMAKALKKMFNRHHINLIFKASYDKANRSSINSFRGPGIDVGLKILEKVKKELDLPILTDVHLPDEVKAAAKICDIIQIPAFLCRQTDLIIAAGETKATINIKKGQFLAPWDIKNVIDKLISTNNDNIILTERGTSFGYNNLVSDMRAIPIMQSLGYPVCFDASHSIQLPGNLGTVSGGEAKFIPTLAKAAIAAGCNALFIESHPTPARAKSDSTTVLALNELENLLQDLEKLYRTIQEL